MKKNKMVGIFLASALVTSAVAVGSASAAADQTNKVSVSNAIASQLKVVNGSLTIDGSTVSIRTVLVGKTTLYSLRDLADALGAAVKPNNGGKIAVQDGHGQHILNLQTGSTNYQLDGGSASFITAPQNVNNAIYVELASVVEALGGEFLSKSGELKSQSRLSGEFANPFFDASGNVVVSKEDGEIPQLIKLHTTASGDYESFSSNENAVSSVLSPDRTKAAFTNDKSELFILNTSNGYISKLGSDTTVKTDLAWTQDGKKIYFIQGDKQEKIAYIDVETGKVTGVLADKVENKSEVQVSADQSKIVYFVNVTGTAETDKAGTEESLKIDYSKAGTQLFSLDITKKDAKPAQLTSKLDNKLFLSLLSSGEIVYVSADPDGVIENSVLKVISTDGTKLSDLAADIDVISAKQVSGKLIVLAEVNGNSKIYEVTSAGAKTELYSTEQSVSEFAVSSNGSIVLIEEGKVVLVQGGVNTELTK
ncbi:TolB protein [Fontibacillus solani]|uniref:TolB protein n=1 Tax=Fontibacillus solani TaxID=1572857 RepID=A0A7W3SXI6_9BACL|nr:stalk domain-containing protein [Fontibacillus solani]MBA9088047.1 TolB protein [Fontibacillus solani]